MPRRHTEPCSAGELGSFSRLNNIPALRPPLAPLSSITSSCDMSSVIVAVTSRHRSMALGRSRARRFPRRPFLRTRRIDDRWSHDHQAPSSPLSPRPTRRRDSSSQRGRGRGRWARDSSRLRRGTSSAEPWQPSRCWTAGFVSTAAGFAAGVSRSVWITSHVAPPPKRAPKMSNRTVDATRAHESCVHWLSARDWIDTPRPEVAAIDGETPASVD